ncbi:MAG: molecular chaperone HtpG [Magnetococcales bacterium]|nr:molecular chaperone HtpG [Magnetococcales bacterium]
MSKAEKKETLVFQTEVRQLLDLMIHSLYSNKEIFLRELISNSSDALDKLRFEALSNNDLYGGDADLCIRVTVDTEAGTVTISDNGIGMEKDDVVNNIGTIAKSGTKEFLKSLTGDQAKDSNLIGQFGVGFYSSFIVADKVTLITRKAGTSADQGVCWESAGDGKYTLEQVEKEQRGTDVILHVNDDQKEFLEDFRLRSIVRKFSDHVSWPIMMLKPEMPDMPDMADDTSEVEGEVVKEGEEKAEEKVKVPEWETVNKATALWIRPKSEIKEEEYNEFYKHVSHDFTDPLAHIHVRLEGAQEYTLLLYIPKSAPFDLWDRDAKNGVKLYTRRVFIMEGAKELMPRYLRFVRGVIDSADLPLNVSREILQTNPLVEGIKKGAVGKVFSLLEDMAKNDPDKYQEFWKGFGLVIKEGIVEDFTNKDRLSKLLRFTTTTHGTADKQEVSLEDYVSRMKPEQEKIYYVTGESHAAAKNSPHLEVFTKKGIEVLLLSDRVDEWLTSHLNEFDGKTLQSVAKGGLDLGKLEDEAEKEDRKKTEDDFKDLVDRVKKSLDEKISEVRMSSRLTESPACLVGGEHDMSSTMERILKEAGQQVGETKRILELNPTHPLILRMKEESDEGRFTNLSQVIHDQALLSEGGQLENPADFVKRFNSLLLEMAS